MFCQDFFIVMSVNVLSWLLRTCFVMISSYMLCHDFFIVMSVNDPKIMFRWSGEISPVFSPLFSPHEFSWFHRKCFVKTSSYMFCQDFFIVMSVNQTKIYFRWRGEISPLFSPHEFSWFLHRKWFVKHERICFVETSSS